jgi:hypothetical protein
MRKAASEGGFFLFLLYKFRIASSNEITARFCTCHGYEWWDGTKGLNGKTVLWFGRRGVDRISTIGRRSAYSEGRGLKVTLGFANVGDQQAGANGSERGVKEDRALR